MKLRRLFLQDNEKLIKVKSWMPSFYAWKLEWPMLLIDRDAQRMIIIPVWDLARIKGIFK